MISVFHGDDLVASRKNFLSNKDKNSITFDSISILDSDLEQALSSGNLFGEGKKIFIENLFNKKAAKNYLTVVALVNKYSKDAEIFIWHEKEVGRKLLSEFDKVFDDNSKIPSNIFGFLDNIRPQNKYNLISFHEALKNNEIEIVFFMIIRQFRLLLGILSDSMDSIDEVKRLAPWQKEKLQRQARFFGEEQLKSIYKKIYKIDKSIKTGRSNLTLEQNVDILLLEI